MKKIKIIALVLACVTILTGCGGISPNIKLAPTNATAANFLGLNVDEMAFIINNGAGQVANTQDSMNYDLLTMYALSGQSLALSVVSTIDFCIEIADRPESSEIDQKVYEYMVGSSSDKCFVFVSKVSGKSNVFSAVQYVAGEDDDFAGVLASGAQAYSQNQFTVSVDKSSGAYSFSDTANDVVGEFIYAADGGYMKIDMSYQFDMGVAKQPMSCTMEFCNYTNGVLGGRIKATTSIENQKQNIIFEMLAKPFDKRAKMGIVKDASEYCDMKATEEIKIAVSNVGDQNGFAIMYVNNSDATLAYTTVTKYGLEA